MTGYAATQARRLPRGWAHLLLQVVIWMGFYAAYQLVRGQADRDILKAFTNGEWVITTERRLGALFEPSLQRLVDGSHVLVELTSYTYWLSQFVVVGSTLLWVYLRHHERFYRFRNTLILANLTGLVCYLLVPTAPPRMFPSRASSTRSRRTGRQPLERADRVGGKSVRSHAEPARHGRADRRAHHGLRRPEPLGEGDLAALVAVGLVQRHVDR